MEFVKRYRWPGNVRQLTTRCVQAAVMAGGPAHGRDDFAAALDDAGAEGDRRRPRQAAGRRLYTRTSIWTEIHRHYLRRAMEEAAA